MGESHPLLHLDPARVVGEGKIEAPSISSTV